MAPESSSPTSSAPDSSAPKRWTIADMLKWATDDFRTRGIENPRLDAEVIVAFALGVNRTQLIVDMFRPLAAEELATLRELVRRRRSREPVAYLRGQREFYGRNFKVDARVLVPRPDTETLVEVALARSAHVALSARVLDVCTGSGCVGITLARERPTTSVILADVSAEALAVAAENLVRTGAYNAAILKSDLLERVTGPFDLVTANPPYIATEEMTDLPPDVRDFEPRLALDGGHGGLVLMQRLVDDVPRVLAKNAVFAVELGLGQADRVAAMFQKRGFEDVRIAKDYGRIDRIVSGVWPREGAR